MKKLKDEDIAQLEGFINDFNSHWLKIQKLESKVNDELVELNDAIQAHNNTLHNVKAFAERVVADMDLHIKDKSGSGNDDEDWSDTEEGQNYEEWRDQWASLNVEDMELIEDVNIAEPEITGELDQLPTGCE
jgi:hypothetical protein